MKQLNNDQYNRLTPYAEHLRRGYYGNYSYCLTRTIFNNLMDIYRELGYTQSLNYNCSTCLLQLTRTLGELYFKYTPTSNNGGGRKAVKVKQYTLDNELLKEFNSIAEAARESGINKGTISAALKSESHQGGGYVWLAEE